MIKYDLLVYLGLIPLVAVIIFSGFVIWRTPTDTDLETRKIRMADAVLVGLLALFIFTAILYFVDPEGAGEEIFNKASPVIFALVGILFGLILTPWLTYRPIRFISKTINENPIDALFIAIIG